MRTSNYPLILSSTDSANNDSTLADPSAPSLLNATERQGVAHTKPPGASGVAHRARSAQSNDGRMTVGEYQRACALFMRGLELVRNSVLHPESAIECASNITIEADSFAKPSARTYLITFFINLCFLGLVGAEFLKYSCFCTMFKFRKFAFFLHFDLNS